MKTEALLRLPGIVHHELQQHLLREPNGDEQAAFVFARFSDDDNTFHFVEWLPVPPDGFAAQLPYHFELTDATRAQIIKRAHDLGASLIEFHSHTGPWPAQFSSSDWSGFEEVVPHVRWRLKGRHTRPLWLRVADLTDSSGSRLLTRRHDWAASM